MTDTPFFAVQDLTLAYRVRPERGEKVRRGRILRLGRRGPEKHANRLTAVNRVSFAIPKAGQTLAIVGESGCGKSSLAAAILRVLPNNVAEFSGNVWLEGENLRTMSERELRDRIRWKKIAWVPQKPGEGLNPVHRIGSQIEETLYVHKAEHPRKETLRLLKIVGLDEEHAEQYPHQLSGGMQQRVCVAMALALKPALVILDEPTSALDVSLQGEVLNLLQDLRREFSLSYLFITHNIGLAAEFCDLFAVFYAGRIVERGPTEKVFANPLHPYTRKLIECATIGKPFERAQAPEDREFASIPGEPPDLRGVLSGCPFAERPAVRCAKCSETCAPELREYDGGHFASCHGVGFTHDAQ